MPIKLIKKSKKHLEAPTPLEIIRAMRNEYIKELYPEANKKLRARRTEIPLIYDALSAWVSRTELEALLNDNTANGMRIYYGIHHVRNGDLNPDLENYGRHNLILVATIDKDHPTDPTTENSVDQLKEDEDPALANSIITCGAGDYTGLAADQLPLCPPRCPIIGGL